MRKILALIDFDQTLTKFDMLSYVCWIVWKMQESENLDNAFQVWKLQWIEWLVQRINLLIWIDISILQDKLISSDCLRPGVEAFFSYLRDIWVIIVVCSWNVDIVIQTYSDILVYDYLLCPWSIQQNWIFKWTTQELIWWDGFKVEKCKKLMNDLEIVNDDIVLAIWDSRADIWLFWLANYTIAISPRWWLWKIADEIVETDFFEVKELVEKYLDSH